jgi:predicted transcriptional regulator
MAIGRIICLVTNARLQTVLDKNSIEIGWFLSHLMSLGLLVSDKHGRWTTYHLNTTFSTKSGGEGVSEGVNEGVNEGLRFTSTQKDILAFISVNPSSTYTDIATKVGISIATVYRNITILKGLKVIERVGSDKTGYWKVLQ